ncbi:MAG: hypothetical protein JAY75_23630, partial [Candidatus Thiodiazotropha taylori]|nr:hypothetical protein [Candidatus Thiodiazotropha taylori]MCW4311198.1 hypothetical protein [Candidatus Thiodiazotropha endolucinida]
SCNRWSYGPNQFRFYFHNTYGTLKISAIKGHNPIFSPDCLSSRITLLYWPAMFADLSRTIIGLKVTCLFAQVTCTLNQSQKLGARLLIKNEQL